MVVGKHLQVKGIEEGYEPHHKVFHKIE